ncbi:MAG: retropepsin-like domain-containing protein [Planctomycetes bacterium]|nr:retropepsin-like domain-containing protein [Planctomycetota bacterium]
MRTSPDPRSGARALLRAAASTFLALLASSCVSVSSDPETFEALGQAPAVPVETAARALFQGMPHAESDGERVVVPLASSFGLPALRARIDGAEALLLIDTGARFSYATAPLARRAGLRLLAEARTRLTFLGEPVPARMMLASAVQTDGIRWVDVPFFVTLRRTRLHVLGITLRELEGGIGADLLRSFRTTIDAPGGRIIFEPPGAGGDPIPDGAVEIPLEVLPDGRPAVAVSIDGQAPERFLLDTCSTHVTLDPDAARSLGIPPDEGRRTRRTVGFGTQAEVAPARLPALSLGGVIFRDVAAGILMRPDPDFARNGFRGILGIRLLGDRRIALDFPGRRLVIGPERP